MISLVVAALLPLCVSALMTASSVYLQNSAAFYSAPYPDYAQAAWKAYCPVGQQMMGVSFSPSPAALLYSTLCLSPVGENGATGLSPTYPLAVAPSDTIGHTPYSSDLRPSILYNGSYQTGRSAPLLDWANGYWKWECPGNAYMMGLTQYYNQTINNAWGWTNFMVTLAVCAQSFSSGAPNAGANHCHAYSVDVASSTNVDASGEGAWAPSAYYTAECVPGQVMYGISVYPGYQQPHSILCCDE